MERAYTLFHCKKFDDEKRELVGIASTPTPDRYADVVEPKGADYELPLPLLWQHDSAQPIGLVTAAVTRDTGIEVRMRLVKIDEPGTLKDRLDEAWQSIKSGLVRGLSIGFKIVEATRLPDGGGLRIKRWEWLELSAVTIPANAEATITAVKRYAARAHRGPVRLISATRAGGIALERRERR